MQLLFATAVLFRVQGRIYVFVATIQVPHAGDCVGGAELMPRSASS